MLELQFKKDPMPTSMLAILGMEDAGSYYVSDRYPIEYYEQTIDIVMSALERFNLDKQRDISISEGIYVNGDDGPTFDLALNFDVCKKGDWIDLQKYIDEEE